MAFHYNTLTRTATCEPNGNQPPVQTEYVGIRMNGPTLPADFVQGLEYPSLHHGQWRHDVLGYSASLNLQQLSNDPKKCRLVVLHFTVQLIQHRLMNSVLALWATLCAHL